MDSPTGTADPGAEPPLRKAARGSVREAFDSGSLANQFRLTALALVTAAVVAVQLVSTLWDVRSARGDALAAARARAESMALRLQSSGGGALDDLAPHPEFLAATFSLEGGEVLQRYVRGEKSIDAGADLRGPLGWRSPPEGAWHAILGYLALEPIYVESPVDFGSGLKGSVSVLVDHRWIWNHGWRRLAQTPLWLLIGGLLALVAARSLTRRIVEPLQQLADTTRPRHWAENTESPARNARRGNVIVEIADNFQALTDRLAAYERDIVTIRHASNQQVVERTRDLEARTRKAEAIAKSKDEFLASMSHEIRTPMNGVLGMAELLSGTDLDKRQRRFVDSMRAAAETMMQIINAILDDSKIEAGKMDLIREPFDVRELAEQAGQLYAGPAERKKLEMICRIEPTVPSKVVGDALRLRQVLGNLLSNAVKYTERGEVEIRIGLDDTRDGHCRLHFSVRDTGPGIPDHDQSGVFQAFTQLRNATRVGGTGLGLSIASRLVHLMGGDRIQLASELGRGSTFSFVLPFDIAEAAPVPDRASDEFAGLRVLVIDDNATSYMLLEEMLTNWSAEVSVLNRARLVGDRMHDVATRGRPFDVVLLDHNLPDGSTEELLRTIRLDPAIAGTYVVLMSALDFNAEHEGAQAIAPDVCIAKPVRASLLRSALQASRQPREAATAAAAGSQSEARVEPNDLPALCLNVLVVDDNEINREVAVAMLEQFRCKTAVAADGREAVEQAAAQRFDLILMDCQMPGMDGYAATEAIRRGETERSTAPVQIVALSANVLSRDRDRCIAAGMNSFLAKPFSAAQLLEVLQPIAVAREASGAGAGAVVAAEPDVRPVPAAPPPRVVPKAKPSATSALLRAETVGATATQSPLLTDDEVDDLFEDGTSTVTIDQPVVAAALQAPEGETPDAASLAAVLPDASSVSTSTTGRLPILDLEQVQSIRGLGKPQVFERLCDMLATSSKDAFERLDAALAAGDLDEIGAAAHALKSPVANLGGRRLAELLERCETAARESRDLVAARRAAAGLKAHYAALVAALETESRRGTGTG